jgi:hypothetical protein
MNIEHNKNEDANKLAWSSIRQQLEKIYEGGGKNQSKNNGNVINLLPENE